MPTYLLAFAVGPYDLVDYGMIPANSIRDREIHLRGITANREQVIKAALYEILQDEAEVERIFLIIKAQGEY